MTLAAVFTASGPSRLAAPSSSSGPHTDGHQGPIDSCLIAASFSNESACAGLAESPPTMTKTRARSRRILTGNVGELSARMQESRLLHPRIDSGQEIWLTRSAKNSVLTSLPSKPVPYAARGSHGAQARRMPQRRRPHRIHLLRFFRKPELRSDRPCQRARM